MSFVEVAEVWRGAHRESVHHGVAAVVDAEGRLVASVGDPDFATYPRSSLKPFQALALVETGAADTFGLSQKHLALACASHRGQPFHLELVQDWLLRIGCTPADLACGAEFPLDVEAQRELIVAGLFPTRAHHNCSGKHTGMLTVCRHCGFGTAGYAQLTHPLQERIFATLGELIGRPPETVETGIDGCALPAAFLTMRELALACARFAAGRDDSPVRAGAMRRLLAAMRDHPDYVSGTDQPTVQLTEATQGRVLMKTGAEGFIAAWLPEAGLGLGLKIADGQARAAVPLLIEVLAALDVLDRQERDALAGLRAPSISNSVGAIVGALRPTAQVSTHLRPLPVLAVH